MKKILVLIAILAFAVPASFAQTVQRGTVITRPNSMVLTHRRGFIGPMTGRRTILRRTLVQPGVLGPRSGNTIIKRRVTPLGNVKTKVKTSF